MISKVSSVEADLTDVPHLPLGAFHAARYEWIPIVNAYSATHYIRIRLSNNFVGQKKCLDLGDELGSQAQYN
jgi:hypothetical protein